MRLTSLSLVAMLATIACGASPTSPSQAHSAPGAPRIASSNETQTRSITLSSVAPGVTLSFSKTLPGSATATNLTASPYILTFTLMDRLAEFNQRIVSSQVYVVPAGSLAYPLSVGGVTIPLTACQVDGWRGIHHNGETLSDLQNDFIGGNEKLFTSSECSSASIPPPPPVLLPPPPPVVTVCLDIEANNYRQPGPCVYPPIVPKCEDRNADNYGKALPCIYPKPCPIPVKKG